MITPEIKPYGSWKSPITSSMIVESAIRLSEIVVDQNKLYWNESRPSEKGRSVIVTKKKDQIVDLTFEPYNVRTRVHEYGGASFTAYQDVIYFANFQDQHFYSLAADGKLTDLTKSDNKRYANPLFDPLRKLIYAIEEEHVPNHEVKNSLAVIDSTGKSPVKKIHTGYDFYASPTLHPNGTHLVFLTWNHPLMPWDGTEMWEAKLLPDGSLVHPTKIVGGISESIFQPRFAPDGTLYFVSDRSGYWNLYRLKGKTIDPCYPMEAEFGYPHWIFGTSLYDFIQTPEGLQIICVYTIKGVDHLALLNPNTREFSPLPLGYTSYTNICVSGETVYFEAASPTSMRSLIGFHLPSKKLEVIRRSKEINLDEDFISKPETIEFPSENGNTAYGFFYPPKNKGFRAPPNEKPPLIVKSHGGPSSHTQAILNLEVQFWTSRGFAVFDVNYGGSTGYGREYRERLKGKWGITDVDDCTNGAKFLTERGLVDPNRIAIKGGSAGGYTALAALAFRDVFKAGVSYYGVSDLEALAKDTHKFESRYLEGLIGAYPQQKERYIEASPIHHVKNLSCPIILLQGAEDKVVPPAQAEMMYQALKEKGIPVAYILFEGEQHGFRQAETIKRALDAELYFYSKIFKFEPSDQLEPIPIENLK